jgi:hypothetical protein
MIYLKYSLLDTVAMDTVSFAKCQCLCCHLFAILALPISNIRWICFYCGRGLSEGDTIKAAEDFFTISNEGLWRYPRTGEFVYTRKLTSSPLITS